MKQIVKDHAHAAVEPTAAQVAEWLGGELKDGAGAPGRLSGLATLAEAREDEISFVASDKAVQEAPASRAGLLIVSPHHADALAGRARVVVAEVWAAVARLMERLYPPPAPPPGIHPTAIVGRDVKLGHDVSVGPYCVLGDGCELGDGAVLGPHCILDAACRVGRASRLVARVTLVGRVEIGARVLIHPGAVIGADGFKFELVAGAPLKIPQVGRVVIEDDVEIGANTTIDRAFLYETRVGRGAKIDNLVQIAHNVHVGPGCILAAQVGVAGSARLGAGCLMGGQVGVRDNITVGDGAMIGAQAGLNADVPPGQALQGSPAMPMKQFWRVSAALARLPEYARRLRALEMKDEEESKK
jgi:UDP-3-O-[3-hydroxymyristoyl] glucosamine N-acyltransferase